MSGDERARYLDSLKEERGKIAMRPKSASNDERLAHIDEVIDSYSEKPTRRRVEKR